MAANGRVLGGRDDHMAAAVGRPPKGNPVGVYLAKPTRGGDRRLPILDVPSRADQVAGLAVTLAEAAVVEQQRGQPGRGEPLGERRQAERPLRPKTVGHDDHGRPGHALGR